MKSSYQKLKEKNAALQAEIDRKAIEIYHLIERPFSDEAIEIKLRYGLQYDVGRAVLSGSGTSELNGIYNQTKPQQ